MANKKITEIKPKPNKEVINQIEELLKDAEAGQIQNFAFAYVNYSAELGHGFSGGDFPTSLLGEIECLKRNFMDSQISLLRCPLEEFCE